MKCLEIMAKLNNKKDLCVFYDLEKEVMEFRKDSITILISDVKNMINNVLIHLCNNVYDIEKVEFINMPMYDTYYNEINECIESDFYKEDMEILKKLFDEYMISNNI